MSLNAITVVAATLMVLAAAVLADPAAAQRRACVSYDCIRGTQFCGYRCASRPRWVPDERPLPTCDAYRRSRGWC